MTKKQIDKWKADPVGFAGACVIRRPDGAVGPIELSDRQKNVLAAVGKRRQGRGPTYKTVGVVWPKRSGKTLLAAIAVLWKSLRMDLQSICLSNSREQAQAHAFDFAQEILERTPEFRGAAEVTRNEIRLPWGASIRVVPCLARNVAGIGVTGLLVTDELWQAQSDTPAHLLMSQTEGQEAQTLLVSQASGRTKYVYQLYQTAEAGEDRALYFDYMTPEECRAGSPNPYLTEAYIESRRQELPGPIFEHWWHNVWGEGGQALLDGDRVEACFDFFEAPTNRETWEVVRREWERRGYVVNLGAGLDRSLPQADRDASVWTVTARLSRGDEQPIFHVLRHTVLATGAEREVLWEFDVCRELFGEFPSYLEVYQCSDLVGRIAGASLETPSAQRQQALFNRLSRAVAEGRLHASSELTGLRDQLLDFEIDTTSALAKFGAPGTATDDQVYSLVWAMACADAGRQEELVGLPARTYDGRMQTNLYE